MPAGIVWHQGESDASHTRTIAKSYRVKLTVLMNKMREELHNATSPIVIGQISDSMMGRGKRKNTFPFGDVVKTAQRKFTENDDRSAIVAAPEGHKFIDAWHYDSQTYIELGERFANAMKELQ
jgi:hypothetical protein